VCTKPMFRRRSRIQSSVAFAVILVSLFAGIGGASARDQVHRSNHCISPLGTDLNELYGISAQIVAPYCTRIDQGKAWTVTAPWFMLQTYEAVPDGFVPAGDTPIEDFLAKFIAVRYVVDPGTRYEQTYEFPNDGEVGADVAPNGLAVVNTITLGTLRPLRPGTHVVEIYWSLRALHCDGFSADVVSSCLPAGEFLWDRVEFQVAPGQRR
jgi:hypothetical protein